MASNQVKQVSSGLLWTYAERMTAQLITIAVTVVLARLVVPSDYGLISIVSIFINIANAFVVSGFGNSLIQKRNADDLDFSTVFYFSLVFAMLIYVLIFLTAEIIASFYEMPKLVTVLRVMGLRIPVAAVNSVQHAYISKKMQFKKFFFATLGGTIVSAIIGIAMAYKGFGIWALVVQYLTNTTIDTIVLWFTAGWRPRLSFSLTRMKGLFSFGWRIMCVGVFTTIYSNLKNLVIGKKYTSSDLAYSEKGEQFPSAIADNINSSITKVLFPVLSAEQDNLYNLKRMVKRSISVGTYILFPVLFGFAVVADSFVNVFLTDKWIGCVPFIQIMCASYALQPLQTATLQMIKATGRSDLYLTIDIIKKTVGMVVLLVSIFFFKNVVYIVLGSLVVEVFSVVVLMPVNKSLINYGYCEQIKDILPAMVLSALMVFGIALLNHFTSMPSAVKLAVDVAFGAFIYMMCSLMSKNDSMTYIWGIVKGFRRRSFFGGGSK